MQMHYFLKYFYLGFIPLNYTFATVGYEMFFSLEKISTFANCEMGDSPSDSALQHEEVADLFCEDIRPSNFRVIQVDSNQKRLCEVRIRSDWYRCILCPKEPKKGSSKKTQSCPPGRLQKKCSKGSDRRKFYFYHLSSPKPLSSPFFQPAGWGQSTVTVLAHGFEEGDIVMFSNSSSFNQIGGLYFKIAKVVDANNFKIDLDSLDYPNPISATNVQKLFVPASWTPKNKTIVGIEMGPTTKIKTSTNHGLHIGQYVELSIPKAFGAQKLDGVRGRVSGIGAKNSFELKIDSSTATDFSFSLNADTSADFPAVKPARTRFYSQ
jgi:hypothetical protein